MNKLNQYALILSVLTLAACGDDAGTYRMGTSEQEQAYRKLGGALQAELQLRDSLKLDIVETGGSLDNLQRLRNNELDFAFVQGGFIFDDTGLLTVAGVDTEYLHIVVPASSEVRDLSNLADKRVASGIEGTGSQLLAQRIAEAARFDPPIQLIPMTRESAFVHLAEGKVDAAIFVTSLRRELEPMLIDGQFRLVGVRAADTLAKLLFDVETEMIPLGIYGKNLTIPPAPTPSLVVATHLLVRADIPNHAVTRVIEALFDHHVRRDARLPELTERTGHSRSERALHPAAEAYYSRNDPMTSDQFEIAGVLLAALIAALAAFRYVWEWYRRRRQGQESR